MLMPFIYFFNLVVRSRHVDPAVINGTPYSKGISIPIQLSSITSFSPPISYSFSSLILCLEFDCCEVFSHEYLWKQFLPISPATGLLAALETCQQALSTGPLHNPPCLDCCPQISAWPPRSLQKSPLGEAFPNHCYLKLYCLVLFATLFFSIALFFFYRCTFLKACYIFHLF